MIYPGFLYKDGGPHLRPGGTFSFTLVKSQEEAGTLLADGWVETLGEIDNPKAVEPEPELEPEVEEISLLARAKALKIKGAHLMSETTLRARIAEVEG